MHRKLRFFTILALLISIILEITLFNYTHYATLFTSKRFNIEYNKQERSFSSNANEYEFYRFSLQDSLLLPELWKNDLRFRNLNTEIASIYINPIFLQGDRQRVRVYWEDEESSGRFIDVSIIKDLNFSNYITITPRGKVSYLSIIFLDNINIAIKQIEINRTIPYAIMPIRMVIVFGISLLLLCLKNAELREKISYFCFDYLYDKANFRQRAGFAVLICSMLIFNFLTSYSIYGFKDSEFTPEWVKMYSHHMTDALLKKQLHLDIKVPQALLEAERPYDDEYRRRYGMWTGWEPLEILLMHDHAYYKGKYYSYHGMLPVIILFAPYKLLTGNYLPTSMGIFVFASVATILLMLLWKQIAQNYLEKVSYFFFLICAAVLYACSLIPIHIPNMRHGFHLIAQYSALVFVILGVMALLQAKEKLSAKSLLVSSISFALAVACRPIALIWSFLIPIMLWDRRKELICASKMLAIIVPFAIVGSILVWYNYARFGSPFEFGEVYLLGDMNTGMVPKIGIIGKIHFFVTAFLSYLFYPPNLDLTFPFVSATEMSNIPLATTGRFGIYQQIVGIFCFPVMWFLFYIKKINILRHFIFAGIFISSLNVVLLALIICYLCWRYSMDFSWIMVIVALICAFQLQEKEAAMRRVILKAFYSCCGITILLVFFLTIGNILDNKIHYYLARTFGVICNVL